jgi:hypothetical protein
MRTLVSWSWLSFGLLAATIFVGYLPIGIFARWRVQGRETGISPSELTQGLWTALFLGGVLASIVLIGTAVYWAIGLKASPRLRESLVAQRVMQISLIAVPMTALWIFTLALWASLPTPEGL